MATFRLNATGRPCQRMQQECLEGVVSITTKLIARQRLLSQGRHRRNACTSKQTEGPSLTGSLEQIGQIHAPDLLRRNRQDQRKQKQAAKTSAAAVTRGTRVTRATLAARTAQASRPAASGTPSPDNKTSASDNNNSNTILFWWDS